MTTAAPFKSSAQVLGCAHHPAGGIQVLAPQRRCARCPADPPALPAHVPGALRPAASAPSCPAVFGPPDRASEPGSCSAAAESSSRGLPPGSRCCRSSCSGRQRTARAATRSPDDSRSSGDRGYDNPAQARPSPRMRPTGSAPETDF